MNRVAGTAAPESTTTRVSLHGDAGAIDLVIPPAATASDVLAHYRSETGTSPTEPLVLTTIGGEPLRQDASLVNSGVTDGRVLVVTGRPADPTPPDRWDDRSAPDRRSSAAGRGIPWLLAGAMAATVASAVIVAVTVSEPDLSRVAIGLMLAAALVGLLPIGPGAPQRAVASPGFAAAATFAVAFEPESVRLPTVIGISALAAALTAAVARALTSRAEAALRVWIVAGTAVFVAAIAGALVGLPTAAVAAIALAASVLAARLLPGVSVHLPDSDLLDLDRLAVSAWSAREQPVRRRAGTTIPTARVTHVARDGATRLATGAVAIALVAALATPAVLATAEEDLDLLGARLLVLLASGGLLLIARTYRHRVARAALQAGGLLCVTILLVQLHFSGVSPRLWMAAGCAVAGGLTVWTAIALGRGRRSVAWARRAELVESLTVALAIGAVTVASGLFRLVWEFSG